MGNTLALAYNKVQYQLDSYLKDPEADNHAKQLAAQAAQDKAAAKRQAAADAEATADAEQSEADKKAALELAERSKFSSPQVVVSKIAKNTLNVFMILAIIALALYGGKIEANKAIGYNIPGRLLSFLYGAIFFFVVIPKSLYEIYWLQKPVPDYAPLPIWVYVPNGKVEQLFLGLFCYNEDGDSKAAREEVIKLYKGGINGFTGILPPALATAAAATTATAAAATAAAAIAASSR